MWLLSTDRAELCFFNSPADVDGGYAILSHRWGRTEQSFQITLALAEQCLATSANPRLLSSPKIQGACEAAERDGYRWIWIDASCIDRTSSTELSEAVNSMFLWYSQAEVCYAFLEDVPDDSDVHALDSAFRRSRWHTRGWTLQELLAPSVVIFMSSNWRPIGTKLELAVLLQEITGIDRRFLTHSSPISEASISERMYWASKRKTSRPEDEAYCLMGVFQVHMTPMYGEGRRAFYRLQHEIMKHSFDTSLFVWGPSKAVEDDSDLKPVPVAHLGPRKAGETNSYLLAPSPEVFLHPCQFTPHIRKARQPYPPKLKKSPSSKSTNSASTPGSTLTPVPSSTSDSTLASMPASTPSSTLTSMPASDSISVSEISLADESVVSASPPKLESEEQGQGPFGKLDLPRFTAAGSSIKCHLPVFDVPGHDGLSIVVLLCEVERGHLGLLIRRSTHDLQDANETYYYTGHEFTQADGGAASESNIYGFRYVYLGPDLNNLRFMGQKVSATWRDVLIKDIVPSGTNIFRAVETTLAFDEPHKGQRYPFFRVPRWLLNRLAAAGLFYAFSEARLIGRLRVSALIFQTESRLVTKLAPRHHVVISLGMCKRSDHDSVTGHRHCHWAKVRFGQHYADVSRSQDFVHDCATDHIDDWTDAARDFENAGRTVRLSFAPWRHAPETTRELHVELKGDLYERMMRFNNVSLPSPLDLRLGASSGSLLGHCRDDLKTLTDDCVGIARSSVAQESGSNSIASPSLQLGPASSVSDSAAVNSLVTLEDEAKSDKLSPALPATATTPRIVNALVNSGTLPISLILLPWRFSNISISRWQLALSMILCTISVQYLSSLLVSNLAASSVGTSLCTHPHPVAGFAFGLLSDSLCTLFEQYSASQS